MARIGIGVTRLMTLVILRLGVTALCQLFFACAKDPFENTNEPTRPDLNPARVAALVP